MLAYALQITKNPMSHFYIHIAGIALLLMTISCASSDQTTRTSQNDQPGIEVDNDSIPLSDYLRRVAGVTVYGSGGNVSVNIRGSMSFETTTEPLFVIDGQRVGRDYSRVESMVPVADIATIRVVKGVEASSGYGLEGGNGVIEITTKRN